jgi:hypothetical protein
VVPTLFGYSEQARIAKRESRSQASGRTERGEEAYLAAVARSELSPETKAAIDTLLKAWPTTSLDAPHWSFGVNAIFVIPYILSKRGLFHMARNGDLEIYFGYWTPDTYSDIGPTQIALRDQFYDELRQLFGVQFNDKQLRGFPTIKASQWAGKAGELVSTIKRLIAPSNAK